MSKFLALVLRHQPQEIGLELDEAGWVPVEHLLAGLRRRGLAVERSDLERIAAQDDKQRYALRGEWIRANQGHSVAGVCAVELAPVAPPELLYHGTTRQRWAQIQASGGLKPLARHHVHLSADPDTAWKVGARYRSETPMLLKIQARAYQAQGGVFFCSANGVWMADSVPLAHIGEIERC